MMGKNHTEGLFVAQAKCVADEPKDGHILSFFCHLSE
jgi:hypothetical protein